MPTTLQSPCSTGLQTALDLSRRAGGADSPPNGLARLGIKASNIGAAVQTLSGGNQQRVVLAKWLATNPKILILDSPTAGVDIRNKQGIYDIIHKLADEGVAIILISDEIPEVYFNADRILHMREGRMVNEYVPGVTSEMSLAEAVFA